MKYLLYILLAMALFGCGRPGPNATDNVAPEDKGAAVELEKITSIEEAQKLVEKYAALHASAEAKLDTMIDNEQKAQQLRLQRWGWIIAGLCFAGSLVCVALAFFVETARKLLITGAVACVTIATLALGFTWLIPYLRWIGVGLGGSAAIAGIWYIRRAAQVAKEHMSVGTEALMELDALDHDKAEKIKETALERQCKLKIHKHVAKPALRHKKRINDLISKEAA